MTRRILRTIAVVLVCVGVTGCGKSEPDPPKFSSRRVSRAKKTPKPPPEPYTKRPVGPATGTLVFESYRPRGCWSCLMEIGSTDVKRLNLAGGPVWSPDGTKIAVGVFYDDTGRFEICVMDPDGGGRTRITRSAERDSRDPAWSPDGKLIAFSGAAMNDGDIHVMNADGTGVRVLAPHKDHDGSPTWSPDGKRIAFESNREGHSAVFIMNADGTDVRRLTGKDARGGDPAWSPDGTYIAWVATHRPGGTWTRDLRVIKPDGKGERTLVAGKEMILGPSWSPGSDWIAFGCHHEGKSDIHIVDINGEGHKNLLNDKEQDNAPSWRPVPK